MTTHIHLRTFHCHQDCTVEIRRQHITCQGACSGTHQTSCYSEHAVLRRLCQCVSECDLDKAMSCSQGSVAGWYKYADVHPVSFFSSPGRPHRTNRQKRKQARHQAPSPPPPPTSNNKAASSQSQLTTRSDQNG